MKRYAFIVLLSAVSLLACHHRAPVAASTAPEAARDLPPKPDHIIRAFVPISDTCHWVHLDAATGEPYRLWPVPVKACPDRAMLTTGPDGTTLFSAQYSGSNVLWAQGGDLGSVSVLPRLRHMEMAWIESGQVHATTFGAKADEAFVEVEPGEEEFEELTEEEIEEQWVGDCYTYALTVGLPGTGDRDGLLWELVREETVELHEGQRRPYCDYGDNEWSSTSNGYYQYNFETFEDAHTYADAEQEVGCGIVYEMDATKSGKPCIQDCDDGELLRRYAFGNEWFEGPVLKGGVVTFDGDSWSSLEGLEGSLREFFLAGDQLIVCTDEGFGAWDHVAGTRTWWKDTPTCPVQSGE